MAIHDAAALVIGTLLGFILGTFYFASLRLSIEVFVRAGFSTRALLDAAIRMSAAIAMFWLLAQWNGIALVSALGGFLLARYRVQKQQVKADV